MQQHINSFRYYNDNQIAHTCVVLTDDAKEVCDTTLVLACYFVDIQIQNETQVVDILSSKQSNGDDDFFSIYHTPESYICNKIEDKRSCLAFIPL